MLPREDECQSCRITGQHTCGGYGDEEGSASITMGRALLERSCLPCIQTQIYSQITTWKDRPQLVGRHTSGKQGRVPGKDSFVFDPVKFCSWASFQIKRHSSMPKDWVQGRHPIEEEENKIEIPGPVVSSIRSLQKQRVLWIDSVYTPCKIPGEIHSHGLRPLIPGLEAWTHLRTRLYSQPVRN